MESTDRENKRVLQRRSNQMVHFLKRLIVAMTFLVPSFAWAQLSDASLVSRMNAANTQINNLPSMHRTIGQPTHSAVNNGITLANNPQLTQRINNLETRFMNNAATLMNPNVSQGARDVAAQRLGSIGASLDRLTAARARLVGTLRSALGPVAANARNVTTAPRSSPLRATLMTIVRGAHLEATGRSLTTPSPLTGAESRRERVRIGRAVHQAVTVTHAARLSPFFRAPAPRGRANPTINIGVGPGNAM